VIKGLCEDTPPPERVMSPRHVIACHLSDEQLLAMEPVITIRKDKPEPALV
jgi:hypothetical protein